VRREAADPGDRKGDPNRERDGPDPLQRVHGEAAAPLDLREVFSSSPSRKATTRRCGRTEARRSEKVAK